MNIIGQLDIPKLYQYNTVCLLQIEHDGTEIWRAKKVTTGTKKYLLFSCALGKRSAQGSHLQKVFISFIRC